MHDIQSNDCGARAQNERRHEAGLTSKMLIHVAADLEREVLSPRQVFRTQHDGHLPGSERNQITSILWNPSPVYFQHGATLESRIRTTVSQVSSTHCSMVVTVFPCCSWDHRVLFHSTAGFATPFTLLLDPGRKLRTSHHDYRHTTSISHHQGWHDHHSTVLKRRNT